MKKTRLLIILLALALVFSLAACKDTTDDPAPCEHVDADNDMLCDLCGEADCYNHADTDGNRLCDFCGDELPCDGNHVDSNSDGKCDSCNEVIPCDGNHADDNSDGKCDRCNTCVDTHADSDLDLECDDCGATFEVVTVAEALELCGEAGNITTERYYVRATVKTVSSAVYGEMTLVDESGEIYVYGTYSRTGAVQFGELESKPQRGDEVILHCILQNYNGTKEIKNARLVGFVHNEADISEYTSMTVADARDAEEGELIIVEGVVARVTFANGMKPVGVMLVDDTQSIYVYGADVAGTVAIGNKIKVAGVKDYWVLDSESWNADKFGYEGCNQLSDAILLENDGGSHDFDKSWITETTVKAIMDTPVTEDITTTIFKVNALVKKAPGSGFINYYIDDLDGVTGSYVYTQCNGGDFAWLDEFDGKICTVYLTALNAKSNTAGCVWRFLPVAVVDEGYTFNTDDTAKFAVDYHALGQFLSSYAWNSAASPVFELVSSVSSELLGFEGATLTYSSSDNEVITFVVEDGVTKMKLVGFGEVTVTVTGTYGTKTYSTTLTIVSNESSEIPSVTVSEAIAASKGTEVIVKGIVGPSLTNKTGFYLIDESGVIAVTGPDTIFEGLSIGNEVVIKGIRNVNVKDTTTHAIGQTYISDVEILANDYGSHDYSTETFVTDKTVEDIYNLDPLVDYSTTVYVTTATVTVEDSGHSSNIYLSYTNESGEIIKLRLYCSGSSQYSWLKAYAGQTVTVEVAACNWNDKNYYTGCALAVVNEDGTKVYNDYNFK